MKKLASRWLSICSKPINFRIVLLCKIFVIWLLLQFFIQTFVTFKLWRDWKFWTLLWMWKEFVLLVFVVILFRYILSNLKSRIRSIKNKEHVEKISRKLLINNIKSKFILQFCLRFVVTAMLFLLIAICIQYVWLKPFALSIKYDLIWFFIFGIWICLALLFFSEKDKELLEFYNKIIVWSLRIGLFRWFILWLMPNVFKIAWFDPNSFEWTVGQNPPVAYYTKIYPYLEGSHVRNSYLFERPTSFWFWLVAFFPVFMLWFIRRKRKKDQLLYIVLFWLLIFSTWSRAWIAIWMLEAIAVLFMLNWRFVKKHLLLISLVCLAWLWCIVYVWRWILVREHSNTWHLLLMKAWWEMAKKNIRFWRGAWYSGPASHQLCFSDKPVDIFQEIDSIHLENQRCETIRKENVKNQISTYGFNPENQYLQILMEYGIIWIIFRLWLCAIILRYTAKMIWIYRKKNKSPYQELLYYSLLWFGIWFVWLCAEGIVLHSLVDRMIVYPFFLLYWITVWLWENCKNETYIPLESKKKKSKKR